MKRSGSLSAAGRTRLIVILVMVAVLFVGTAVDMTRPSSAARKPAPQAAAPRADERVKGVWLNYMAFAAMIDGNDEAAFQTAADAMLGDLADLGLNTLFLHVRSHSDSLYPSSLFPWSVRVNGGAGVDYDPLAYIVARAHALGIAVHGWINPYRISTGTVEDLPPDHPARTLAQNGGAVVQWETGVYYDPSSDKARNLILSGVRELLDGYALDGIQYDDYFYPTADPSFDRSAYETYASDTAYPLSLADWRRCQVNLLIAGTYQLVHRYPGVVFGVSPAADVERDREEYFADAAAWAAGGYVDYLCPQLYFGFHYPLEEFRFDHLLAQWQAVAGRTPLYVGLASYKVGSVDAESTEWVTATDLLSRQTDYTADFSQAAGVCLYHYGSLFQTDPVSTAQREHLKKALARFSESSGE